MPSEAGLAVAGCTVKVTARAPNGQISMLTLKDDGAHDDGDAHDGEYARRFTECCERLVKLLERQTKLLADALAPKKPKPKK